MTTTRVSFEDLLWISGCLGLVLAPHITRVPVWVFGVIGLCAAIRLMLARRGSPLPPRALRLLAAALSVVLLFAQLHTFNGLTAGTALLALTAGLKLLETETKRDIYVITLIIYFVGLSALLEGTSFWLLAYLIGVCWFTSAALLRLTTTRAAPQWRDALSYCARLLAQALPFALIFWLLFPRFAAPLWHLPSDSHAAGSGLSDTMSPGDISDLALSDDIAFRVRFASVVPPAAERYWRGPVLHEFDGHTWRHLSTSASAAPLHVEGAAYRYTLSLEPNQHNWIFALDWPTQWDVPRGVLTNDYTLVQPEPISRPMEVDAISYTHATTLQPLSVGQRKRDTALPVNRNPRTLQLSRSLRAEHSDDMDYARSILALFAEQPFFYTLAPPKLADDSVDAFLFDVRRGFCGHYASAFAVLMRAAGIPARVVTGYYGGAPNRFADYWILRQSDAHAWDEIWIDGRGWVRIDPTASIAPSRVEHELSDSSIADEPLATRWHHLRWIADARLRLDALRQAWRERVLFFDQQSQQQLLEYLRIPQPDGQKLVLLMAGALALGLCWLTWQVRREIRPVRKEAIVRAYDKLCAKLAAIGLARLPHEGPQSFSRRVGLARPDLKGTVTMLCRHYSTLRYGTSAAMSAGQFIAAARAFKPSRARPGRAGSRR